MGSFDTWMAGDPSSVEAAANWLGSVRSSMIPAAENTSRVRITSGNIWKGDAADAYRDFNKDMTRALDQAANQLARVNDLFLSYAQQLRWRQEDMQQHRDDAIAGGLVVNGTVVFSPTPVLKPGELAPGATKEQRTEHRIREAAYECFVAKDELYAQLLQETARTFQQLTDWIAINLVGKAEELETAGLASAASTALATLGYTNTSGATALSARINQLRKNASTNAHDAARRASGNPAVRFGGRDPNPTTVAKRIQASQNTSRAEKAAKASKYLGRLGGVVTAATAGLEISQGSSPSTVAVGIVGGAIGATAGMQAGIAGGAAAGTAFGGEFGGLLGATAGGIGGALLVSSKLSPTFRDVYTKTVPQHVRELIDEGLHDAWPTLIQANPHKVAIRPR